MAFGFFKGLRAKLLPIAGIELGDNTTVSNSDLVNNYIQFPTCVASPTANGWRTYADAAGVLPVDGTGGTPNTTLAQNTAAPLSSLGDFRIVKSASASRQGEGISTDFTVSSRHLARILQVTFDMELVSGTYTDRPLRVYLIQDPAGTPVVIEPVNTQIDLPAIGTRGKHIATFQTHATFTNYRLCIHISGTDTNAYTVDFNNFRVWEPEQNYGAIITDWVSYTPSYSVNVSSKTGFWRRVGGEAEVKITLVLSGGQSSYTESNLLPSGITVDINKLGLFYGSEYLIGYAGANDTGVANTNCFVTINSSRIITQSPTGVNGSGDSLSFYLRFPVPGWGSSLALSSDAGDGRVVSLIARGFTAPAVDVATAFTTIKDTHNCYSGGLYTVPIPGDYLVSVSYIFPSTSTAHTCYVSVNGATSGSNIYLLGYSVSTSVGSGGSVIIPNLRAGDTLSIRAGSTTFGTSLAPTLSINRVQAGSQIIASSEDVNFALEFSGGTIAFGDNFNGAIKIFDSHNIFNTSNGTFSLPMSGKYMLSITAGLTSAGTASYWGTRLLRGATVIREGYSGGGTGTMSPYGNVTFPFSGNAGDVMKIEFSSASSAFDGTTSPCRRNTILMYRVAN